MANIDLSQLITAEQKQAQSLAILQSTFEVAVQGHLDSTAKAHGYDNVMTAVSYADEPAVAKFQADGKAFRAWRSKVWAPAPQWCSPNCSSGLIKERESWRQRMTEPE